MSLLGVIHGDSQVFVLMYFLGRYGAAHIIERLIKLYIHNWKAGFTIHATNIFIDMFG